MNVSNLEKSSIDEVLSKSIDFNWVSSKKNLCWTWLISSDDEGTRRWSNIFQRMIHKVYL